MIDQWVKQNIQEEIEVMKQTLDDLKACRKALPSHVKLSDLPEAGSAQKSWNER